MLVNIGLYGTWVYGIYARDEGQGQEIVNITSPFATSAVSTHHFVLVITSVCPAAGPTCTALGARNIFGGHRIRLFEADNDVLVLLKFKFQSQLTQNNNNNNNVKIICYIDTSSSTEEFCLKYLRRI